MKEGDHIHSTILYSHISLLHLQLQQWQQGCCHYNPSLSLSSSLLYLTLTPFALQIMPLFIGNNGKTRFIKHGTNYATTCASTLYQMSDELF
jgi:hypothetical protein